jgi:23S rRNA-/tRNA-specific pseudouridylate synthase
VEWVTYGNNTRLDHLLRSMAFAGAEYWSRAAWQEALDRSWIWVEGRREKRGGRIVPNEVEVKLVLPEGLSSQPLPDSVSLVPVSSLGDFLFFSKASAVHTVPHFPWEQNCLAHGMARWFKEQGRGDFFALAEPPSMEGGCLQRLDYETSGLVTVALTPEAKREGRDLFSGKVAKTYLCLTPRTNLSAITFYLSGTGAKRRTSLNRKTQEDTVCEIKISELGRSADGKLQLTKVITRDGQRHIVRAGMAAAGAPLWGDHLYGGEGDGSFYLHAYSLTLPQGFRLKDPPPKDFLARLEELKIELPNEI